MMAHVRTRKVGRENRYDVCWRAHGKDRSRTFIRLKDAEKYAVDVTRRGQLGQLWEADPVTLQEARDDWRSRWMLGKAASTVSRVDQAWPHVKAITDVPLDDLRSSLLEDTIAAASRIAPRQAQLALQTVKQVLKDAQRRGQRFAPELLHVTAAKYESRERTFLTAQEIDLLAEWCTEANLVTFLALSGLRIGEAVALRDSDIDRRSRSVLVQRSASKGVEGRTKTRKHRRVDLCERAWAALLAQLMARPKSEMGLVFPSPMGLLWDTDRLRSRVFRPAVKLAALKVPVARREAFAKVSIHDLRHSYASLMLAAGERPKDIAEQMGHSDGGVMVLRRYGHLYPDAGRVAARALDAYLAAGEA